MELPKNLHPIRNKVIMIKNSILCSALILLSLQSCQTGGNSTVQKDTVFSTSSYIAVDGKDTALLTLKTGNNVVKGKLLFKFYQKESNDGSIRGAFRNDTLFVDYSFTKGANKVVYKNPLALLKKDGQLILGVGKMENTFGRTYFRKDIPIDFNEGRFTFASVPNQ